MQEELTAIRDSHLRLHLQWNVNESTHGPTVEQEGLWGKLSFPFHSTAWL